MSKPKPKQKLVLAFPGDPDVELKVRRSHSLVGGWAMPIYGRSSMRTHHHYKSGSSISSCGEFARLLGSFPSKEPPHVCYRCVLEILRAKRKAPRAR